MHIGINAQLLSFGQNYRNGGVSRYIRYLLRELARQPGEHHYTVFINGEDVIEQLHAYHPQITYVSAPWPETQPTARVTWEQFTLPNQLRQRHIDVLHSPVNVLPALLPKNCASVVTLHDLAFLRFPEVLTTSKRLYHRTFTLRSLRQATAIVSVSESTRTDAHTLAHIPLEKIHTVHMCIDSRFANVHSEEERAGFRQKHGLTDGYILYLGTLEPRKNIPTLIEAYHSLRQSQGRREKLVLAGGKGWLYDEIFARIQQLGLEQDVIFPGYVNDQDQELWYQAASVFAFPSLYEGFGIPVAEALAGGTPVVTTNVSSLPEAGLDLALCVAPQDSEALASALHRALTDTQLQERCREEAYKVMESFSVQRMVTKTIAVYEQAARERPRQQVTN
ncbi:glycosyl transferase family 1 [Ktedonobacter sp. SOSP1-52]|uniref:glycosyltransferase family 4 protein n=1 Tax=Ktedonobacter sp. SOSP1-52 TaxID=2778366 RepID=UPI0019158F3F|nr:glycosyltransferase family 1 protein [Ktedonobacter sp. SOSP1-52]GHO65856.1 glycosyl transferase family 1 [Ktedonobacter sp. SOSP1-52]